MHTFGEIIVKIINEKNVNVTEAILIFAEKANIDIETIGELVKNEPFLVKKIEEEALSNNMLKQKKSANLEVFFI